MTPTRLFEFIYSQKENFPLEKSFGRKENGKWIYWSTDDMINQAMKLASGLIDLGLKPGDKIAISAYKNRPEWVIADLGSQMAGIINVPVYPTISPKEYEYILNDSEVQYAFVGAEDLYDKMEKASPNVPSYKKTFTFDRQPGKPHWEEVWSEGNYDEIEKIKASIKPDDLATIIYTSGTTGNPKGVMLNHTNICHVVINTMDALIIEKGKPVLSFLPLCHIFERAVSYGFMFKCSEVHFTGTDNLGGETGDLQDVKPYFFSTVPRLLEKVYEKIYNKGLTLEGAKKKLFFWALDLTEDYTFGFKPSGVTGFKWKLADKLIFSKWREALGGNVKMIVTGAAPCPRKMAQVFSAAGIPIREGYGLTETSPTLSVNNIDNSKAMLGTVGPILPGVEIQIDRSEGDYNNDEGEIIAKGPNVMMGYYNNPEANAKVFKEINGERWFRTGDIGTFVTNHAGTKCLKITDRKKELLKTSGGKYVAPAPIENKLKEDFLIEQVMVVGDKQKFVSALILPAHEALQNWCKENDVDGSDIAAACNNEKVIAAYQKIISDINPNFSHIEQIKKFKLLACEWGPMKADGSDAELTPTLKLKRRVIREKHKNEIADIYNV